MREFLLLFLLIQTIYITVIGHYFYPKYFQLDEIDHVRNTRDDKKECSEDNLMELLAEMQVINPENIMEMATLSQIEPMCSKVAENMVKFKKYLTNCKTNSQPDLYIQLISGVDALYKKFCSDSDFKKRYEPFHQCLRELRNDFQECSGPPDWNEYSDKADVCKAYKEIADCYYIKSAKVCGKEAAKTLKELLKAVIDSIITVKCDVNMNPVVKDPMPEAYIKKISSNNNSIRVIVVPGNILLLLSTVLIIY